MALNEDILKVRDLVTQVSALTIRIAQEFNQTRNEIGANETSITALGNSITELNTNLTTLTNRLDTLEDTGLASLPYIRTVGTRGQLKGYETVSEVEIQLIEHDKTATAESKITTYDVNKESYDNTCIHVKAATITDAETKESGSVRISADSAETDEGMYYIKTLRLDIAEGAEVDLYTDATKWTTSIAELNNGDILVFYWFGHKGIINKYEAL